MNSLDILVARAPQSSVEHVRRLMPGTAIYGSRVFGEEMAVTTSFTPDEHGRERYFITAPSPTPMLHVKQLVETIVKIETYYHLILMQKPMFSSAVDQVYRFEQLHLKQREIITSQLAAAGSTLLQHWLNALTEDVMKVNRLAGLLQFELSAAVPYDKIVHASTIRFRRTICRRIVPCPIIWSPA